MLKVFIPLIVILTVLWLIIGIGNEMKKKESTTEISDSISNIDTALYQEVEYNTIKIAVPRFMSPTNELNEAAVVQYQYPEKELYMIIIPESIYELEESLIFSVKDYYNSYASNVAKDFLVDGSYSEPEITQSENLNIALGSISGIFVSEADSIPITYYIGIYGDEDNYYQVSTWTTQALLNENSVYMNYMLNSFKKTERSSN